MASAAELQQIWIMHGTVIWVMVICQLGWYLRRKLHGISQSHCTWHAAAAQVCCPLAWHSVQAASSTPMLLHRTTTEPSWPYVSGPR